MNPLQISKYLAGECSPQEQDAVLQWMQASPENTAVFEQCRKTWEAAAAYKESDVEVDAAWNKLRNRIHKTAPIVVLDPQRSNTPIRKSNTKLLTWFARVAAIITPIAMITWYLVNNQFVQLAEAKTGKGERKQVTLADGTQVWLNAESNLKYPLKFEAKDKREVYLSGEAYFKVSADSNHLFVVNTDKVAAKAYGTSFNVSGYPEQEQITVSLDEGKLAVEVDNNDRELTIHPGQLAKIDKDELKVALDSIRNEHNLWIENKIVFENEPLKNVVKTLERWYNTPIQLASPEMEDCRFTGSFSNQNLDEVLAVLKEALKVTVKKKKDIIYISGEGC